eukprot:scaffold46291_cov67-Phaeocystis_antarctica.AAC.11
MAAAAWSWQRATCARAPPPPPPSPRASIGRRRSSRCTRLACRTARRSGADPRPPSRRRRATGDAAATGRAAAAGRAAGGRVGIARRSALLRPLPTVVRFGTVVCFERVGALTGAALPCPRGARRERWGSMSKCEPSPDELNSAPCGASSLTQRAAPERRAGAGVGGRRLLNVARLEGEAAAGAAAAFRLDEGEPPFARAGAGAGAAVVAREMRGMRAGRRNPGSGFTARRTPQHGAWADLSPSHKLLLDDRARRHARWLLLNVDEIRYSVCRPPPRPVTWPVPRPWPALVPSDAPIRRLLQGAVTRWHQPVTGLARQPMPWSHLRRGLTRFEPCLRRPADRSGTDPGRPRYRSAKHSVRVPRAGPLSR